MGLINKLAKNQIFIAGILYFLITWTICFRFLIGDYLPLPFDNYLLIDEQKLANDQWTVKNRLVADSSYQMYPWRKLVMDSYKQGKLPSFNPNIILGNSLLGNGQSAPFYPGNLFFIFGLNIGWKILFFSQFFLAGFFTFLFLRSIRLSFYSSFLGGAVYGFSGFLAAWDSWTTVGHTILWLPLMFLAVSKWASVKKIKWLIILALSIFCSITAGFPQFALYCLGAVFCYFLFRGFSKPVLKQYWFLGIVSFIWGLGLAAIQLLPIISLLSISNRLSQFKLVNLTGVPLEHLFTFLVPGFFGWPNDAYYFGSQNFNETANFFGSATFALVLIMLLITKFKEFLFWKLLFLVTLILIFNNPVSEFLSGIHALIFGRGLGGRLFIITIFSASVLAARGLEEFLNKNNQHKVLQILLYITGFLFLIKIISMLRYFIFPNSLIIYRLEFIGTEIFIPLVLMMSLIALWFLGKYLNKTIIVIGITILILVDLLIVIHKITPWSPASVLTDQSVTGLQTQLSDPLGKTIGFISTGENSLFNIPTFEGYDSIYPKSYLEFLKENCATETENFTNWVYIDEVNCLPSLQKFGLRYILDNENLLITELYDRWGKQKIDQDFKLVKTQNNLSVYEYTNYKYPIEFNASGIVNSFTKNRQEYVLNIDSPVSQNLTIYLNYLDGWNAKVNNQKVLVFPGKNGFISLNIPEGNSEIVLNYFPDSLYLGMLISAFFAFSGLTFLIFKRHSL